LFAVIGGAGIDSILLSEEQDQAEIIALVMSIVGMILQKCVLAEVHERNDATRHNNQNIQMNTQAGIQAPPKSSGGKKWLMGCGIALLVVLLAVGGFVYWG